MTFLRFKTAVESGRLRILTPSEESFKKVKTSAIAVGDSFLLSDTDFQVLALALELKANGCNSQIITDDYSIQNVATQTGIGFASLATMGIRRLLNWKRYCPACHREYPSNYSESECKICGTSLKRKPIRSYAKTKNKNYQK
jgi:UPF0271 protein